MWCRKAGAVNSDFVFTAKLHRSFTHSPLSVMEPTSAASIRPNDEDERLAREGQLAAYRHPDFWQCMDTLRDKQLLENLWNQGKAPWKSWE